MSMSGNATIHSGAPTSTAAQPVATFTGPIPDSPPPLSISRTSDSLSRTSRYSSPEDTSGRMMHFEDINLDDDSSHSRGNSRRPSWESSPNKENSRAAGQNGVPYSSKRPVLATIQTQQKPRLRNYENGSKSAGTQGNYKRNFTSPSPTASASAAGQRSTIERSVSTSARPRSESPALHKSRSTAGLGRFAQTPATSLAVPSRRGSWQPARKTIYEIEAEYHDSDDELPDDASLYNVPISPFIQQKRSLPHSAASSARGSPERDSGASSLSPMPFPLAHARSLPDAPSRELRSAKSSSRHRPGSRRSATQLRSSPSQSASTSPREPRDNTRYNRSRSWNLVLDDLDHETRIVAEKLDFYNEANAKIQAVLTTSHRSSAPGAIPLPPIQRGTLDFMPISREKEAVLSRTRPSWLPPKDPKEEKRHLDEYMRMMKASMDAEKKRERLQNIQVTQDETRASLHRIWTYYIDPTTDLTAIDSRVNELCWRGIPSPLRGQVWQRCIGNKLDLTADDYAAARTRVDEIKSRPAEQLMDEERTAQEWFADIERDAETAFPDVSIFKRNAPQWQNLVDLCEALAVYRRTCGYSYGAQLVAALVLLQTPAPADAFILLANCLNRPLPLSFHADDAAATQRTYKRVMSILEVKFPRLSTYLFATEEDGGLGFQGADLFTPMFSTLFANGLDLERLCRVWDVWMFDSDRCLIRVAVALLGTLQEQIFGISGDISLRRRNIQEMLGWGPYNRDNKAYWNFEASGGPESFIDEVRAAGRLDCTGN